MKTPVLLKVYIDQNYPPDMKNKLKANLAIMAALATALAAGIAIHQVSALSPPVSHGATIFSPGFAQQWTPDSTPAVEVAPGHVQQWTPDNPRAVDLAPGQLFKIPDGTTDK